MVKHITIEADFAGQRIDNFLLRELKNVPKSRVYRIIRKGEVRVNKKRIKPEYKLQADDIVRVPPVFQEETEVVAASTDLLGFLETQILLENDDFLVMNKPEGLAVHGGSGLKFGLIEALRQARPEARFLELVHRLDRETSGCLIIAKKRPVLRALHEQLREGQVEKIYMALMKGRMPNRKLCVDLPLLKDCLQSGERMVFVKGDGKPSKTDFTPVERFANATLCKVRLHTGRTHQIRVHAQHSGYPLAGDEKYGDKTFNKSLKASGLRRLFLHAFSLKFTLGEEDFVVEAPLPQSLLMCTGRLESRSKSTGSERN